jgi:metallo-beta-lactamase family protein
MKIGFYGAAGTVTGSRYLLQGAAGTVLVDCGLFQGYKQLRLRNWSPPPFDPAAIDAVILTHAHLDHSGYLPVLVRLGFKGPVYCTPATADLCRILLPDSGRIQEEDARRANRHRYSKHDPALPLYTEKEALRSLKRLRAVDFRKSFAPARGFVAELHQAGHILGAAMVHLREGSASILFSGDLGRISDPVMLPPAPPVPADCLVLESTYGDRRHEATDPEEQLGAIIRRVVRRRGVVLIPAFAVGRTQSLLHFIRGLKHRHAIPRSLPVFLNGPLATEATALYRRHCEEHRLASTGCEALCEEAAVVATVEESKALNRRKGPMIIIAGSGMATGGRVVHHLKAFAPDPRNAIVLAGFQAGGTRGAALEAGTDAIKIHGEYVPVRAEIAKLENISAHADAFEMLDWLRLTPHRYRHIYLTHGEPAASDALRQRIARELRLDCSVPDYRDVIDIDGPDADQ